MPYIGREKDEETGLGYHSARYYAGWLGRWCAADPGGMVDGVNRFAYSGGDPVGRLDGNGYSNHQLEVPAKLKLDNIGPSEPGPTESDSWRSPTTYSIDQLESIVIWAAEVQQAPPKGTPARKNWGSRESGRISTFNDRGKATESGILFGAPAVISNTPVLTSPKGGPTRSTEALVELPAPSDAALTIRAHSHAISADGDGSIMSIKDARAFAGVKGSAGINTVTKRIEITGPDGKVKVSRAKRTIPLDPPKGGVVDVVFDDRTQAFTKGKKVTGTIYLRDPMSRLLDRADFTEERLGQNREAVGDPSIADLKKALELDLRKITKIKIYTFVYSPKRGVRFTEVR